MSAEINEHTHPEGEDRAAAECAERLRLLREEDGEGDAPAVEDAAQAEAVVEEPGVAPAA